MEKMYRIFVGQRLGYEHGGARFNFKKQVYSSYSIDDALEVFEDLKNEHYAKFMILIADYSVMSPMEAFKYNLIGERYPELGEVEPYVIIDFYSSRNDEVPMDYGFILYTVQNGKTIVREYNDTITFLKVVEKCMHRDNEFAADVLVPSLVTRNGKLITKIRKRELVSTKLLNKNYFGCKWISISVGDPEEEE